MLLINAVKAESPKASLNEQ